MKLSEKLTQQKRLVAEFEAAIEQLQMTNLDPSPTPSAPLEFLRQQFAQSKSEADRVAQLDQAKTALAHSRLVLADLEQQWAMLECQSAEGWSLMRAAAIEANELVCELLEKHEQMQTIAARYNEAHRAVRGQQLLDSSQIVEFTPWFNICEPIFVRAVAWRDRHQDPATSATIELMERQAA